MVDAITPNQSELGKKSIYSPHYNPDKLLAIPRQVKRDEIGITQPLPFYGLDIWNHYEVSWLNQKGKPVIAIAEIIYGCNTPYIIESKSMKLYFNSFNHSKFKNIQEVEKTIKEDITRTVHGPVRVKLLSLAHTKILPRLSNFKGVCLDDLDIHCDTYLVDHTFLKTENKNVKETFYSHLLKSNCLVTHQPDWGSIQIKYQGRKINREGLLRYLVSYRNHNEFHEQCIERIFMDIMRICKPKSLAVYGRYTRRGGIDINPFRTTSKNFRAVKQIRLYRQ